MSIESSLKNQDRIYPLIKRVFDFFGSFFVLVVLSPLLFLLAILIRLDSPGPSLFRQKRIGKDGKAFIVFKFRSMVHNADQSAYEQFISEVMDNGSDPGKDSRDAPFRLKDGKSDLRVTRFGHYLRKYSLDELPQLYNVLRGEMSFVGPRPDVPLSVEGYSQSELKRLEVPPGLTGLWQVSGRSSTTVRRMFELDVKYVEQQSFWLDLWILVRTIPVLITGSGAG